jgi:hypothetical protein
MELGKVYRTGKISDHPTIGELTSGIEQGTGAVITARNNDEARVLGEKETFIFKIDLVGGTPDAVNLVNDTTNSPSIGLWERDCAVALLASAQTFSYLAMGENSEFTDQLALAGVTVGKAYIVIPTNPIAHVEVEAMPVITNGALPVKITSTDGLSAGAFSLNVYEVK